MNNEIILFISNSLTAILAWVISRRKQNAESDNIVLKNLELSINIYAELVKNLKEEIQSLNLKIQELEKKVDDLHAENIKLKSNSL
jgi:peptidoglycan hydrolase CwlO-like protein